MFDQPSLQTSLFSELSVDGEYMELVSVGAIKIPKEWPQIPHATTSTTVESSTTSFGDVSSPSSRALGSLSIQTYLHRTAGFMVARKYSKEHALSLAHGFFISMGGFVTRQGHHPIILPDQLTEEILSEIRATKVQDIEDKSKGDAVSKGLALLQTLWFLVQILTRAIQHLPISELEIATVAFAILNLLVYGLWWYKPLDVQRPIMIGPGPGEYEISATSWRQWFSFRKFMDLVFGQYSCEPEESISVPIVWVPVGNLGQAEFIMSGVAAFIAASIFGAIHCFAWNFSFPTSTEQMMWRISAAFIALFPFVFVLGTTTGLIADDLDSWRAVFTLEFTRVSSGIARILKASVAPQLGLPCQ
ncbi:hypothetical protein D9758_007405 [Tetrapyrgos nigripes]|uniref:Uncharacterized protein n=1 Tax=Tetrapyrgos nigripes TaxID=182062 RepID=A0A8H5LHV8_9AGAR|nr:hypothetical protein D9758_007405 [Tetrapyrgos nigripes]